MNFVLDPTPPRLFALLSCVPRDWAPEDYVLCGSACMAARGLRDVRDLDLLVRPSLWSQAEELYLPHRDEAKHQAYADRADPDVPIKHGAPAMPSGPRQLICTTLGIDVFTEMPRIARVVDFETTFAASDILYADGRLFNVISLRHALAIKALANRHKDLDDMIAIAQAIAQEEA